MVANTAEFALEIQELTRRFGPTAAVDCISLSIRQGEIICLVGHSGCGKSTLLRLIAGVDTPDGGTIFLEGKEISGPSAFTEPEARNIGFVFQDYALFPHLSVEQNILFGLKACNRAEAIRRSAELIDRMGITHLADRFPHMLSGGEQQRVALARALAPQPRILLMDEPFSNLDPSLRDRVRNDTLSLLKTLGTTVIMVTHDPEEALSAGDRVVLMKAGRIVQAGTGYDLHDRPLTPYAAEFFCDFNKVPGVYRRGKIETAIGGFSQTLAAPEGSSSTLYIRPQAISVARDGGDLSGRIVGRSFHGQFEQFLIRVDELEIPLTVRTTHRLPQDVDLVRISIDSGQVLAFSEIKI
ncbi:ABC transporter ATP-binding protein [Neorhizobium galegae]|uniref:ABC transporter ATP-binding protein n=1 Tax=Neorhizobium galegae TaxID=399 RepID=UPI00127B9767|nr:ABC transporter ATP-binding protein [Neorhizobium galegae]KAA9383889.1 ABC transporter ATP-binding protein [Neorhizobium galegae]KAB1115167.1 ABC transporter ATP-binding protein [Neorhizobium galegae]MCM2496820.1 ABC transporter ATP-binding protein [Neorhizobium galegae]MCQ1775014.1 ABC transporter ATP-binding protein [Neorhizobium galegae]